MTPAQAVELVPECQKAVLPDGLAHLGHKVIVVVQIVDAVELTGQNLVALEQVAQVGPGEIFAGITGAKQIQRANILLKAGIFNNQFPL